MNLFIFGVLSVAWFLSYSKMIYNFIKIGDSANTTEEREKHLKVSLLSSIVGTITYFSAISYFFIYGYTPLM